MLLVKIKNLCILKVIIIWKQPSLNFLYFKSYTIITMKQRKLFSLYLFVVASQWSSSTKLKVHEVDNN